MPHKQRLIAEQTIKQQALVGFRQFHAENIMIMKIHVQRTHAQFRPRMFRLNRQRHPFFGLHVENQHVLRQVFRRNRGEHRMRHALERDDDFADFAAQTLAGAQIKRDALPAPIFNRNLRGHKRLGLRIRRNARLLAIADDIAAVDAACAVLPAHNPARQVFKRKWLDGAQHFDLFVAHAVGVERGRRFHRHEREHLQHVILKHVAQLPGLLVISGAMLHAERLRHRDLHVVNILPIPNRLENRVRKAEHQNILHRHFAEIVVNPINLRLSQRARQFRVQRHRAFQIAAKRFFDNHPRAGAIAPEFPR